MDQSIKELQDGFMAIAKAKGDSVEAAQFTWYTTVPDIVLPKILSTRTSKTIDTVKQTFVLARKCNVLTYETRPLGTVFFVGKATQIEKILPKKSSMKIPKMTIFNESSELSNLFHIIDGDPISFEISENGKLVGARILSFKQNQNFSVCDSMFLANLTKNNNVICVRAVKDAKCTQIFEGGNLLYDEFYVNNTGIPSFRILDTILDELRDILNAKKISITSFREILTHAIDISHSEKGAMLIVGDAKSTMKLSTNMLIVENSAITLRNTFVTKMHASEFFHYATADGAVILDEKIAIRGMCMRINPKGQDLVVNGKGTRHNAALNLTAECNALAVVVSSDGLISIMDSGKIIMSF